MSGTKPMAVLVISALLLGESPLVVGVFVTLAWLLSLPVGAVGSAQSGW
jgi:hypothetical protein